MEGMVYISEWLDAAKKAIELITKGAELIEPKHSPSTNNQREGEKEPSRDQLLRFCKDLKEFWNIRSIPLRHEEDELNDRLKDLLKSQNAKALPVENVPENTFGGKEVTMLDMIQEKKALQSQLFKAQQELAQAQKDRDAYKNQAAELRELIVRQADKSQDEV